MGFSKKAFFAWLTILSIVNPLNAIPLRTALLNTTQLSATSLKCASMNNQECKVRPEIVNVNFDEPVFFIVLVLKQVFAVVVVTISMIHMQNVCSWRY